MATSSGYQEVDVLNHFGTNHDAYKSELYKFALTKPSEYFDLRKKVLNSVKNDAIKNLYKTIYNLMLSGKDIAGNPVIIAADKLEPQVPVNKINNFALSAVATMTEIVDDMIEMLLPLEINNILTAKFTNTGIAENIQN